MDASKLGEFYDYVTKVTDTRGRGATPPAYIADRGEWVARMLTGRVVDGYFVYATTLSVLLKAGDSVHVTLFVMDPDSFEFIDQNATLRISRQGAARLYGLSHDFTTSEEMEEGDMVLDDVVDGGKIPFTAGMEKEAIRQLAQSLRNQFEDPMFRDHLTASEKEEVLAALGRPS